MREILREIFLQPLFNLLIAIYNVLPHPDLGIAAVVLIVLLRIVLWPIYSRMAHSQLHLQRLQPEITRIQQKHKDNKAVQTQELLALYRRERFNPFAGFFLILIQVPIILAIYRVFLRGVHLTDFSLLYPFVKNPGHLNPIFLGWIDLTRPFLLLAFFAGIAQLFQSWTVTNPQRQKNGNALQQGMASQMLWVGPIVTVVALWRLPAVIGLYWFLNSVISGVQQLWIERRVKRNSQTQ